MLPLLLLAASTQPWHDDLAAARRLAKAEGKPLMVVFRCEH